MATRALGWESCIHLYACPAPAPAATLLGLQGVPSLWGSGGVRLGGVVNSEVMPLGGGPSFQIPNLSLLFQIHQATPPGCPPAPGPGLSRCKPGSLGAASLFGPCPFLPVVSVPVLDPLLSHMLHLGTTVIGFIPTVPSTGPCPQWCSDSWCHMFMECVHICVHVCQYVQGARCVHVPCVQAWAMYIVRVCLRCVCI